MAFLFCDSFDHYVTADAATKYPSPSSPMQSISAGTGRRGTASAHSNGNNGFEIALSPGDATCIVGYAWKPTTINANRILRLLHSGVIHLEFLQLITGAIEVRRGSGGTILGTTSAGIITVAGGYHAMEIKMTVDDSAGVVVMKVNGATVLNLTGQDTRNGGTAGWTSVQWFSPAPADWDDVWICDGTGSANNDFLGDLRVDAHYPNANGNSNQSTPSTGTDRFATVDEATPNSDTDYNTITGVGDKDTLNIQSLVNSGAAVKAVQTSIFCKKTDSGAGSAAAVARQDGVDYDGTSFALGETYGYKVIQPYSLAPDGTAWDETKFNALEVGYKRTA